MKKSLLPVLVFIICFFCVRSADAKVRRVNNAPGVAADFKEVNAAIASSAVAAGDTLCVEGSATVYLAFQITKKLVLIGSGYLLSGTGANTGLQAMGYASSVSGIYLDSLGSGSTIMGISSTFYFYSNVDDITLTRCAANLQIYSTNVNNKVSNLVINKCFGSSISLAGLVLENCKITNSIFTSNVNIANTINGLVRNNVFGATATINSSYISNNIFLNTLVSTSSTVKYNIASGASTLPAANNNQNGIAASALFENTGSNDGKYQLKAGSPAVGAGEPIGGVMPDAGAFGTADPYRLSGLPAIPSIYSLTVPSSVPAATTSMTITFSTRSNN